MSGSALAGMLAAALTLAGGPVVIRTLARAGYVQTVRAEAPSRHAQKSGTPTMGGLLLMGAALVATLSGAAWSGRLTGDFLVSLIVVALFAALGAVDDLVAIARRRNLGLRAREKLAIQVPVALGFGFYVFFRVRGLDGSLSLPGTGTHLDLGWAYPLWGAGVLVGMVNAVNLTDGLDGLASGTAAIVSGTLSILASQAGSLPAAILAASVAGSAVGFLWYNAHPARVFMGDVGSQGLGAALAVAAVLARREVLLILIGGVFVAEAASVVLQVVYFRATGGRRLFRMSPLHHHYELSGWTETQTVVRFWICAALLAVAGMGIRP